MLCSLDPLIHTCYQGSSIDFSSFVKINIIDDMTFKVKRTSVIVLDEIEITVCDVNFALMFYPINDSILCILFFPMCVLFYPAMAVLNAT